MAIDMKEAIAEAARILLLEKKVRKLTVKDIVEECHITRQTFYYHFEGIPELFRWIMEKDSKRLMEQCLAQEDEESALKYLLTVAIGLRPYVEIGVQTNYGKELAQLLIEFIYGFFEQLMERTGRYAHLSYSERKFVLRYHSGAIIGILQSWTKEDTENLDEIVHNMHLLLQGKIRPFE